MGNTCAAETLSLETLALPLHGTRLGTARTLEELVRKPVLLAFLRHHG